jgi:hypothetical protein
MNAGNLSVSVEADLKALDAQFAAMERAFSDAGARAAAAFKATTATAVSSGGPAAAADEIVDLLADPVKDGIKTGIDSGVKTAVTTTAPAAAALGKSLGEKSAKSLAPTLADRLKDQFSEQKLGKIVGAAIGIGAADNIVRSIASVIRGDSTIGEAIAGSIKSLPVLGAIAELGESISKAVIFGDPEKEARQRLEGINAEAAVLVAQAKTQENLRARAARKAEEDRKAQIGLRIADEKRLGSMLDEREKTQRDNAERLGDLKAQIEIEKALLAGDKIAAIEIERDREVAKARQELEEKTVAIESLNIQDDLARANLQWEVSNLRAAYEERIGLIDDEFALRAELQAIENEKDRAERMAAFEEEKSKRIEMLEEERADAIAAADEEARSASRVGSVSTALGEFKFSAYPDAEKKRMDQQAVDALRKIVDGINAQVKATQGMVFN